MNLFTKQQLFQVRNKIDIHWLINEKLDLDRQFNGAWRFRCPLCQEFNTATQKKTNLGRCFSCQKNFNTIDLVIYSKQVNFAPSVKWLLSLLDEKTPQERSGKIKIDAPNGSQHKAVKAKNRKIGLQEIKRLKQIVR